MRFLRQLTLVLLICLMAGCQAVQPTAAPTPAVVMPATTIEQPVTLIPLTEPASLKASEISGMAWYGDTLILLPQYPSRITGGELGALFALSRAEITAFLDGKQPGPLNPRRVPLFGAGLMDKLNGYEGFESIAFSGNQIFMTAEAHNAAGGMLAYLVQGEIKPDLSAITLSALNIPQIPAQAPISNFSDEAVVMAANNIYTFYEANGATVNPAAKAHCFTLQLQACPALNMTHLDYRLTDATPLDANGRFWGINYFFPSDTKIAVTQESLTQKYGAGKTHARSTVIERLVELELGGGQVQLTSRPPIQLSLLDGDVARNWEAIVRLDERGFLLATDSYPQTLFAFVPMP